MTVPIRVVKVGGSLLSTDNLATKVGDWISEQTPAYHFVMFGGGELIDSVRKLDRQHDLPPEFVHWLCVDLLSTTFRIAKKWFPDWQHIEDREDFQRALASSGEHRQNTVLINASSFYDRQNSGGLPQSWSTTTDSIAALLARNVNATELVLLKSCPIPGSYSAGELIKRGIVDDAFADAVGEQCFRLVSFADD